MAVSLHNVAMLAVRQGDDDRARDLFERAVGIFKSSLGDEHRKTVSSRTALAALPPWQSAADRSCCSMHFDEEVSLVHCSTAQRFRGGPGEGFWSVGPRFSRE